MAFSCVLTNCVNYVKLMTIESMKLFVQVFLLFQLTITNISACEKTYIKYRDTPVCLDQGYEYQDTSKSSWIRGAWYDGANKYFLINLKGTMYHYCRFPVVKWKLFKTATSFGKFYSRQIKGKYDCRLGGMPE